MLTVVLLMIPACVHEKKNVAQTAANATGNISDSKLIEELIGKWKIDSIYAYGVGGSKNEEADINKLIGTEIIFSSDSIKFGNEAEVKPIFYKVSEFSDKHVISDINWIKESTLNTDLNIETLKEISLYEDHQYKNLYYGQGNITYYTDNGELILDENGDLFLLVKID